MSWDTALLTQLLYVLGVREDSMHLPGPVQEMLKASQGRGALTHKHTRERHLTTDVFCVGLSFSSSYTQFCSQYTAGALSILIEIDGEEISHERSKMAARFKNDSN